MCDVYCTGREEASPYLRPPQACCFWSPSLKKANRNMEREARSPTQDLPSTCAGTCGMLREMVIMGTCQGLLSSARWRSGCSGPIPGMRGGLTLQRTHSSVRWFKTVPSRKLGDPIAARAVRRGPARDSPSLTGQGSNSATCRTRRVSLRRQGRVVCSRRWAVPFVNLSFPLFVI